MTLTQHWNYALSEVKDLLHGKPDGLNEKHLIYADKLYGGLPYSILQDQVEKMLTEDAQVLRDAMVPFIIKRQPNATYSFIKLLI